MARSVLRRVSSWWRDAGNPDKVTPSTSRNATVVDLAELEPGELKAIQGGIGPLSFMTSRYGLALCLMALVLNRIHHLVRRPHIQRPDVQRRNIPGLFLLPFSHIWSSPSAANALRIPGVLALSQAWVLLSVVLAQVTGVWQRVGPLADGGYFHRLGQWADQMPMSDCCWNIFLSVCLSLICNNTARGLERRARDDVPAFNLFGLSYLLHLYSSHLTHRTTPHAGSYGRPDADALFELWLCITEVTCLQTIELSETWRKRRLIPTTACGLLGLGHFLHSLFRDPARLPTFMFLSYSMALSSILIIALTIVLNAVNQLFTLGGIQPGALLPVSATLPNLSEDWNICITRLGTACMTTSRFSAGLRNEVAPAEVKPSWVDLDKEGARPLAETRGNVISADVDVPGLHHEIINVQAQATREAPTAHSIFGWMTRSLTNQPDAYGREFWRFIDVAGGIIVGVLLSCWRSVPGSGRAEKTARKLWHARWWYGPRQWRFWRRSAWAYAPAIPSAQATPQTSPPITPLVRRITASQRDFNQEASPAGTILASTFGEDEDASDGEWRTFTRESSVATDSSDYTVVPDDREDVEDPASLMMDLLASPSRVGAGDARSSAFDDSLQPVLLAHITSTSPGPLTRRSYSRLVGGLGMERGSPLRGMQDYTSVLQARRETAAVSQRAARDEDEEERKRMCVVCTVEPRDTILWPCRCLALCGECRENLADRLPAKQHMCPCCRRSVEGFSRIFLP